MPAKHFSPFSAFLSLKHFCRHILSECFLPRSYGRVLPRCMSGCQFLSKTGCSCDSNSHRNVLLPCQVRRRFQAPFCCTLCPATLDVSVLHHRGSLLQNILCQAVLRYLRLPSCRVVWGIWC